MLSTSSPDLSIFFDDSISEFQENFGLDDIAYQRALKFYAEDLLIFDSYEN